MTPSPERQEPERMTIPRLAARVGRSRTLLHRLAANPAEGWPEPTYRPGSTRPEYDVAWFDAYWERRQAGIRQGKRTDLATKKQQQGEPMATPAPTAVDPRLALMSRLNTPPYDDAAGTYSTPLGEAVKLVDAYRAAVLREAAKRLDKTHDYPSGDATATGAYLSGMEKAATLLRRMADEAEASDG